MTTTPTKVGRKATHDRSVPASGQAISRPTRIPCFDYLRHQAERRGLELVRREQTKGKWVWDARDVIRGSLAVKGMSTVQLEQ